MHFHHQKGGGECGTMFGSLLKKAVKGDHYNVLFMIKNKMSLWWYNFYVNLYNLRGFKYDKRLKMQAYKLGFGDHHKHLLVMVSNLKRHQIRYLRRLKQLYLYYWFTWQVLKLKSMKKKKCKSSHCRVWVVYVCKNTSFFS